MTETALAKAQKKFEQAKAALEAIKARENATERKKDTRRKIVIGGALLELARADKDASDLVARLVAGLVRDHDKKLFEKNVRGEVEAAPGMTEKGSDEAAKSAGPGSASATPGETRTIPPMPGGYVSPQPKPDRENI